MLCSYGCNNESNFILNNGKHCCSNHYSKCPELKKKNSEKVKLAFKEGRKRYKYSELMNWVKNKNSNGFIKWKKYVEDNIFILNPLKFSDHKKLLVEMFNWEYKCYICGITSWNDKKIILELDHIDGNQRNFQFNNLRFLCPNCHSQTITYCGKNINNGKKKVSDEILVSYLKDSKSIHEALIKAKLTPKGCNYDRAYKLITVHNIELRKKEKI